MRLAFNSFGGLSVHFGLLRIAQGGKLGQAAQWKMNQGVWVLAIWMAREMASAVSICPAFGMI
jgi:hypothetical protein